MPSRDLHAALPAGTVLGDSYRLTRKLAEGGMAAVYEAVHLRLERRCAVKVLSRELAANTEALARFHREAQITSQLAHPHIVQVTDFGTVASGEPFLVMEYLQGEDLSRRLKRRGRLPSATVLTIIKQITSALSATHARGVIHRDLKPANIFLLDLADGADFVKAVDFGISKIKRSALKLTRASALMGTPSYMSPEQATGKVDDIDPRTDEWALACMTWEMLTGREPFGGRDLTELLYHVVHHDPAPLAGKFAVLSPAVEEVLRRALNKRQRDRWPTVTAFTRALESVMPGQAALEPADTGISRLTGFLDMPKLARTLLRRPEPTPVAPAPAPRPTFFQRWRTLTPAAMWRTMGLRWPRRRRWAMVLVAAVAGGAVMLASGGARLLTRTDTPVLDTIKDQRRQSAQR
jgi:serine/threonine protein kinase